MKDQVGWVQCGSDRKFIFLNWRMGNTLDLSEKDLKKINKMKFSLREIEKNSL